MKKIAVTYTHSQKTQAQQLAQQLNLPLVDKINDDYSLLLIKHATHLGLCLTGKNAPGEISVNFTSGALAHRQQYGGGKKQLLARAIGINKHKQLTVIDVTAGLGKDAFILAALGCKVTMIERSTIIAALLQDGLAHAQNHAWFQALHLQLIQQDAIDYLSTLSSTQLPDVIYCDPMFPERTKSAKVKKEMQVLHQLLGKNEDVYALYQQALRCAQKRVVVKRPLHAPSITEQKCNLCYRGKSVRYDVYLTAPGLKNLQNT